MKQICDRLGGGFIVLLSLALMAGTMLSILAGRCPAEIGFGFITASLLPMAIGRQHHRKCREIQEQIAAAKCEVRMSVAAHADDVRQHVTKTADVTCQKLEGLSLRLESAGRGNSPARPNAKRR